MFGTVKLDKIASKIQRTLIKKEKYNSINKLWLMELFCTYLKSLQFHS